ncbi:NF-X1-type zinc finger protein NFXL1-like, partial [Trifolium medium]|nr:NF-X1-type zinc finger protein NFXL1-like [Trifolium medium]
VVQESGWSEDYWGDEEWATSSTNIKSSVWKKEAPISTSSNPWSVLDQELSSSFSVLAVVKAETSSKKIESSDVTKLEPYDDGSNLEHQHGRAFDTSEVSNVVDDWEKACE